MLLPLGAASRLETQHVVVVFQLTTVSKRLVAGSHQSKLSRRIDPHANPKGRSRAALGEATALRAAGLQIDAFEIGNEYDWVCFNGDIPIADASNPGAGNIPQ